MRVVAAVRTFGLCGTLKKCPFEFVTGGVSPVAGFREKSREVIFVMLLERKRVRNP